MSSLIVSKKGAMLTSPLTRRELQVLKLVADGFIRDAIAKQLSLSTETVHKHLRNGYRKLNAHNKIEAVRKAGLL